MLLIGHSVFAKVEGTAKEISAVKSLLTVTEEDDDSGEPETVCFLNEDNTYLTGLTEFIKRKLGSQFQILTEGFPVIPDEFPEIDENLFEGVTIRDYQRITISRNLTYRCGQNRICTGGGKSLIAIASECSVKGHGLIIVNSVEIARQFISAFKKYKISKVGLIGDKRKDLNKQYTVALIQSLYNGVKKEDKEILDFLSKQHVVSIDEYHHAKSTSFIEVIQACDNAEYKLGYSGSLFDSIDEKPTIDGFYLTGLTGDIITDIDYKYLRENKYLSDSKVYIFESHAYHISASVYNYNHAYSKAIIHNEYRNQTICNLTKQAYQNYENILIVVRQISHGDLLLKKLIDEHGFQPDEVSFYLGASEIHNYDPKRKELKYSYNKGDDNIQKYNNLDRSVLIISPAFFEGVDIPNVSCIIRAEAGRSPKNTYQVVGRGLRPKTNGKILTLIDFDDTFHYIFKNQARKRAAYYRKLGIEIERVKL